MVHPPSQCPAMHEHTPCHMLKVNPGHKFAMAGHQLPRSNQGNRFPVEIDVLYIVFQTCPNRDCAIDHYKRKKLRDLTKNFQ